MWQNELKHVKSAKFHCSRGVVAIDIILPDNSKVSLYEKNIKYFAKYLSEIEIEEAITFLLHDKAARVKQRNFSPADEEMLLDLIKVQEERYSVQSKKDKRQMLGCGMNISKLEEMFKRNYNIKEAHIYLVDIDCNSSKGEWKDLTLEMKFKEVIEDE